MDSDFEKLNNETQYKFDGIIKKRIEYQRFSILLFKSSRINPKLKNKKEVVESLKAVVAHPYYFNFMQQNKEKNSWLRYLMIRFKYEGYVIYPIWRLAYKLYYGRKNKRKLK